MAREPRGSLRFIGALLANRLYVLAQVWRPAPDGTPCYGPYDQRASHRVDGTPVLPAFSSWANAKSFLSSCGIEDADRFTIGLGNDFVLNVLRLGGRVFLNPKTPYEREVWPEEARDLPRVCPEGPRA